MPKFAVVAERAAQICGALVALVFLTSGVVYLYLGHWTVTMADYWGLYDIYLNHSWLESALHKHAEHLIFFPTLLCLADLRFFHGKQLPLFLMGLTLLFLTVGLLLIPVWRDKTVNLTSKVMTTLVMIIGNFWMARSPIIASGGFNCICSLLMASAALAFLLLPRMKVGSPGSLSATLIVLCAGLVTSFSFGVGLAIWPTLLFLMWCLRLPWRSLVSVGVAAIAAIVIYQAIPPHLTHYRMIRAPDGTGLQLVARLCRLVGGPFFYALSGWHQNPLSAEAAQSSTFSLWCGGAGLGLAMLAMTFATIRRDLPGSSLKLTGIALVAFNFVVMVLIIAGNYFRGLELGFIAPRYLFWSTLFWTGLLLIAIQCAESKLWLRWPVYLVALALPVLAFPAHYKSGLNTRWARYLAESAATSLVNGVRDEQQVKILWLWTEQIYRVAEQLRVRRLDMFADGLQDWIGMNEASLFGGRHEREGLNGQCSVDVLVERDNGAPAARVTGQIWKRSHIVPKTLIIVDPTGMICGVARSSAIYSENRFINRTFYLSKFTSSRFLGYIRDYNPQLQYAVQSADDWILSEEKVLVGVPTTNSANP